MRRRRASPRKRKTSSFFLRQESKSDLYVCFCLKGNKIKSTPFRFFKMLAMVMLVCITSSWVGILWKRTPIFYANTADCKLWRVVPILLHGPFLPISLWSHLDCEYAPFQKLCNCKCIWLGELSYFGNTLVILWLGFFFWNHSSHSDQNLKMPWSLFCSFVKITITTYLNLQLWSNPNSNVDLFSKGKSIENKRHVFIQMPMKLTTRPSGKLQVHPVGNGEKCDPLPKEEAASVPTDPKNTGAAKGGGWWLVGGCRGGGCDLFVSVVYGWHSKNRGVL